jgi:hypothetical protein
MLAYLEDLCSALLAHDAAAVYRLLANPLARSLPRQVREEALAISRANPSSLRAPIQVLRYYHQTLQLGDEPVWGGGGGGGGDGDGADLVEVGSEDLESGLDFSRLVEDRGMAGSVAAAAGSRATTSERRDQIELPLEELPADRQAVAA